MTLELPTVTVPQTPQHATSRPPPPDALVETPLDVRGTLRRLWAGRFATCIIVAAFTAAAVAWSLVQQKEYRAAITVSVGQSAVSSVLGNSINELRQNRRGFAVAEVFNTSLFAGRVAGRVNHVPKLRAKSFNDSDLVTISGSASTPEVARLDVIEAVAEYNESTSSYLVGEYGKYRDQLQDAVASIDEELVPLAPGTTRRIVLESRRAALLDRIARFEVASISARTDGITVVAEPLLPTRPVYPNPTRNGISAALLGVVVAAVISLRNVERESGSGNSVSRRSPEPTVQPEPVGEPGAVEAGRTMTPPAVEESMLQTAVVSVAAMSTESLYDSPIPDATGSLK